MINSSVSSTLATYPLTFEDFVKPILTRNGLHVKEMQSRKSENIWWSPHVMLYELVPRSEALNSDEIQTQHYLPACKVF